MPASAKPRKPYRPRAIGRPVLNRMRNDLILPAYSALEVLRASTDADALESARHTLAAFLNVLIASTFHRQDRAPIPAGLDAMQAIVDRQERTGIYRATGGELQALRTAVVYADDVLPLLRTDQLIAAMRRVDLVMQRMEAQA